MTPASHSRFDFGPLASQYDGWYATDEGCRHDRAQKQAVAAVLPRHATGRRRLLDVGCGTGHWSLFFAQQGYEVTGVDISPEMIAAARARQALHCRFDVADAMSLPFPDKSFDVVSAITMLEFVSDARRVGAEMMRCLKSGGCLVIGALNRSAELNRRRVAARSEPYASAQMFAPEELRKLLVLFGNVTIRLTREAQSLPCRTSGRPAPARHELGCRDESGALIVARVVKP